MSPRPNCAVPDCSNLVEVDRKAGVDYFRRVCSGHRKRNVRANVIERRSGESRTWLEEFEWQERERLRKLELEQQVRVYTEDAPAGSTETVPDHQAMERAAELIRRRRENERRRDRIEALLAWKRLSALAEDERAKVQRALEALEAAIASDRCELKDLELLLGALPEPAS